MATMDRFRFGMRDALANGLPLTDALGQGISAAAAADEAGRKKGFQRSITDAIGRGLTARQAIGDALGGGSSTRLNMGNPQHARLASAAFKAGVVKPVASKASTGTSPRPASPNAAPAKTASSSTTRLNPGNKSHAGFLSAAFRSGVVKPG